MARVKLLVRLLLLSTTLISFSAQALLTGYYLGIQGGVSQMFWTPQNINVTSANIDQTSGGGRVFLGYQFNPYFGAEAGFTYYGDATFKSIQGNGYANANGSISEQAVDVVVLGSYSIGGFNFFVKTGGALLSTSVSDVITNISGIDNVSKILWTYGGGISYDLTTNLPLSLTWMRVQNSGNIPNTDLTSLGIAYYFG